MYKNRIIKPVKIVLKREEGIRKNNGSKFDQSTLYACVELSW
jgi:hypothetical protein